MSDTATQVVSDKILAPKVRELHVDFLLEEEFCADQEFLNKFVASAGRMVVPIETVDVKHSASDMYGEADLVVVYRVAGQRKIGLLIEDKIRAVFQPNQAQRYRERGEAGIREGNWDEYWTCLVAPKAYVDRGHAFDAAVLLEEIKDWFASDQQRRYQFKARIVEQAIKKAETTGVQQEDPVLTQFRAEYFNFFNLFFKDARISATTAIPRKAWKGDSWFDIRSDVLPKGAYINHKSERGFVDLTFPSTNAELLAADLRQRLEPEMKIEQTYNSAAIRLEVPKIGRFDSFAMERDNVHQALTAVIRLITFCNRERSHVEDALSRARRFKQSNGSGSAGI